MKNKIPFFNRIIAGFLSILFCLVLIPSFFSLPFELVLFNIDTYQPIIEDEDYAAQYPDVITQLINSYFYNAEFNPQIPPILNLQNNMEFSIKPHVPPDWSVAVISHLFNQTLEYLNFKRPAPTVLIPTQDLKTALISESDSIAANYLAMLPPCDLEDGDVFSARTEISVYELPLCKPHASYRMRANVLITEYLQNVFQRLPGEASIVVAIPIDLFESDMVFRSYSLIRWGFRLLPLLSITLLILIAVLLYTEKKVVFAWIGRLLIIVCGICLFGLVVLLVGFDQFIAILLNPLLRQLIFGFDTLVLGIIHRAGYQTIMWVILSQIATIGFGVVLILYGKYLKPVAEEQGHINEELQEEPEFVEKEKEITPETLEEVEKAEKRRTRRKKNGGEETN